MSTEREIVQKFKEAMETRNIDIFAPYMAEDATCDMLPYTFVVVPPDGTSWILSVMIQGREEGERDSVGWHAGR